MGVEGGEFMMGEKQSTWDTVKAKLNEEVVDKPILEAVTALNVFGIETSQSCCAHVEKGYGTPWIEIKAKGRPRFKYLNQEADELALAKKYDLPNGDLSGVGVKEKDVVERVFAARSEYDQMVKEKGIPEAQDYREWKQKTAVQAQKLQELLDQFYKNREVAEDVKLVIEGDPETGNAQFWVHNNSNDHAYFKDVVELSAEESKALEVRQANYRAEFDAFAGFLKEKFLKS